MNEITMSDSDGVLSHLLFLGLLPVVQEEEGGGQEKHAPKDDDEGAEHQGIAQTEEAPQS